MHSRPAAPALAAATAVAAEDARERLLHAGLRLFAKQGYSKTSTRELAEAASVNVAAISYYFGDKAGLYRAVFWQSVDGVENDLARFHAPTLTLAQALRGFFEVFLAPLRTGELAQQRMRLHFREMLEPTGLGQEALVQGVQPLHTELLRVLMRHLRLAEADADLQRLALSVAGLVVQMHVGRDITRQLAPGLNDGAEAIDIWAERLVMYGLAMVQAEARRRGITLNLEDEHT